ncbi:MAG: GspH/FimT family pseudopilin, partial [Alishewanella sp.]|nr:GspH/FimT family pseudopilin [Alishewanella sp.]
MRRNAGFTLIELMITVVVLGIVATIAVPSFISLVQSNQLTGQINQLVGALSAARTEAIKMNQNVVFCHSSDGATCSDIDDGAWQGWLIGLAPTDQSAGIVAGSMM